MQLKNCFSGAIAVWIAGFLALLFGGAASAVPSKVMNLAAVGTGSTTIQITWTAPTPTSGSLIQNEIRYVTGTDSITTLNWGSKPVLSGVPAPTAPGTTQSMTATGLTPGTTYKLAIKVRDASGWSIMSVVAVTGTSPAPPPADRSVSLAWDPVTDWSAVVSGKGYGICWSEVNGSWPCGPADSRMVSDPTVATVVTGLKRGTIYFFVAMAFGDAATGGQLVSGFSNVVTWTSPP